MTMEDLTLQETPQQYWTTIATADLDLNFEQRLVLLIKQIGHFNQQFAHLGDQCLQLLQQEETDSNSQLFANIIHFEWAEKAKGMLFLWRDLLFEQQKTILLSNDKQISDKQIKDLWIESNAVQRLAWQTLEEFPDQQLKKLKPKAAKHLKKWGLQHNPWATYKEQFQAIEQQAKELSTTFPKLLDAQNSMQQILQLIHNTLQACSDEIETITGLAKQTIKTIEDLDQNDLKRELNKLLTQLKIVEDKIQFENYITNFSIALEKEIEPLPDSLVVVIDVQNGYLEQRELPIKKRLHQWLESESYPILYEAWELAEGSCNGLKMILLNIRNRINALLQDNSDQLNKGALSLSKPLLAFLKDIGTTAQNLTEVKSSLEKRLNKNFQFSYIYNAQTEFLPVSLQATLNQRFWSSKEGWLAKVRQFGIDQWQKWKGFQAKLAKEQALGVSEKIVRCIQNRQPDPQNHHYTSIFMTKGYIGEAFLVGREEQLEHAERIINAWKKGFRGAVLVSGARLSGKTLFAEIIANRYFPDNFVRLSPNTTLTIEGHKTKLGYDLEEALVFLQKYALHSQSLVWIDDLELWWDTKNPFYQNVQALSDWIDSFATRSFVVVGTNNVLKKQLSQLCKIDRIFQAEISMDNIGQEAVQKAIWVRHGATHKKLVNQNQEVLSNPVFQRLCKKIYKISNGNIGEALNTWVNSTYCVDDDHVQNRFEHYHMLPYFLNADTVLILTTILQYKRTNEYTLRKLFGPMFTEQYATVVKRLLNIGILKRQLDGWLEIEELVVNDLKEMIETYH